MPQSVVSLILEGEDSGASAALEGVAGGLEGMGGQLAGMAPGGALAAGAIAGVAAIGAAVVGLGVAAVSMSEEFGGAMRSFQAQTGSTEEEMEGFRDAALGIFNNNWGESLDDVAASMATVQQITGAGAGEIESLTQNALIMRDVFDKDVNESTDAAKVLMDEFGLSSQEAFDLMTTGMQSGLDRNGDFLDTIREYGNQFGDAGFSAEEFFGILESGAAGGVMGTDKIADAIKEMQIKLNEGGSGVSEAFDAIGMDFDEISGFVASGDETWADYFDNIVAGINGIEDPIERQKAQVAIFGTMAEDLGVSFTDGLTTATSSLETMTGATEAAGNMVSGGLGNALEGFKRNVSTSLLPLGDWLGGMLTAMTPHLESLANWLAVAIPAATETLRAFWVDTAWPAILAAGEWLQTNIFPHLEALGLWLAENVPTALETLRAFWVDEAWPAISDTLGAIWEFLEPNVITPLGEWLGEKIPDALEVLRAFWVDTAWPAISETLGTVWEGAKVILEAIETFFDETLPSVMETGQTAWEDSMDAIETAVSSAKDFIQPFIDAVVEFGDWLKNNIFSFNFDIPDIPDWMIPGSPIPLHTAWENFGDYLDRQQFSPQFDVPQAAFPPDAQNGRANFGSGRGGIVIEKVEINDQGAAALFMSYLNSQSDANAIGAF